MKTLHNVPHEEFTRAHAASWGQRLFLRSFCVRLVPSAGRNKQHLSASHSGYLPPFQAQALIKGGGGWGCPVHGIRPGSCGRSAGPMRPDTAVPCRCPTHRSPSRPPFVAEGACACVCRPLTLRLGARGGGAVVGGAGGGSRPRGAGDGRPEGLYIGAQRSPTGPVGLTALCALAGPQGPPRGARPSPPQPTSQARHGGTRCSAHASTRQRRGRWLRALVGSGRDRRCG